MRLKKLFYFSVFVCIRNMIYHRFTYASDFLSILKDEKKKDPMVLSLLMGYGMPILPGLTLCLSYVKEKDCISQIFKQLEK
jgi:hypothetical protein